MTVTWLFGIVRIVIQILEKNSLTTCSDYFHKFIKSDTPFIFLGRHSRTSPIYCTALIKIVILTDHFLVGIVLDLGNSPTLKGDLPTEGILVFDGGLHALGRLPVRPSLRPLTFLWWNMALSWCRGFGWGLFLRRCGLCLTILLLTFLVTLSLLWVLRMSLFLSVGLVATVSPWSLLKVTKKWGVNDCQRAFLTTKIILIDVYRIFTAIIWRIVVVFRVRKEKYSCKVGHKVAKLSTWRELAWAIIGDFFFRQLPREIKDVSSLNSMLTGC